MIARHGSDGESTPTLAAVQARWLGESSGPVLAVLDGTLEAPEVLEQLGEGPLTVVLLRGAELPDSVRARRIVRADQVSGDWIAVVAGHRFQAIVLGRTLESSADPGSLLEAIRAAELLREDGMLIAYVRNVARASVLAGLLADQFRAGDEDALLQHFTHSTFRGLCEAHGYIVVRCARAAEDEVSLMGTDIHGLADGNLAYRAFAFELREAGDAATMARLRHALAQAETALEREKQERRLLEKRLDDLDAEQQPARVAGASAQNQVAVIARLQDELERLRGEVVAAQAGQQRAEERLQQLHASTTWRLGDVLVGALARTRDSLREVMR